MNKNLQHMKKHKRNLNFIKYIFSAIIWLGIWQMIATAVSMELFLPTPWKVCQILFSQLLFSEQFWLSIQFSLVHIGSGFLLGSIVGILLAILSSLHETIEYFLWFPIKTIQSVPVASFVILVLLWIPSSGLSIVIPFLTVLPVLYTHTLSAIKQVDRKLLEMAALFRVSGYKRLRYIYVPEVLPQILAAASLAIGFAWKSGVAAEIIGLVRNSIGNQLYQSKIYLMTPELFAWTLVIIFLSIMCEQFTKMLAKKVAGNKKEEAE